MKCTEQTKLEEIVETSAETLIQLPMGLLGFEKVMNYHLLSGPGELGYIGNGIRAKKWPMRHLQAAFPASQTA